MPNLIDLFAGCGGMSEGFEAAGYRVLLAVEKDEWASETYRRNHAGTKVVTEDLTQIEDLDSLLDAESHEIEGIIGGPPCQGFSLSGNRDPKDPRNSLFMEFVRFVRHYGPRFFVMENVKGILSVNHPRLKSQACRSPFGPDVMRSAHAPKHDPFGFSPVQVI